jgi:hypothetical protein
MLYKNTNVNIMKKPNVDHALINPLLGLVYLSKKYLIDLRYLLRSRRGVHIESL